MVPETRSGLRLWTRLCEVLGKWRLPQVLNVLSLLDVMKDLFGQLFISHQDVFQLQEVGTTACYCSCYSNLEGHIAIYI